MTLVTYSYHPGWTQGDYTQWTSSIDDEGLVLQHMNPESGKTKRKHRIDLRERQLNDTELLGLIEVLEGFGRPACEYLQKLDNSIDDVEIISIRSEPYSIEYSGSLLTQRRIRKSPDPLEVEYRKAMLDLWKCIDRLQPHPLGRKYPR